MCRCLLFHGADNHVWQLRAFVGGSSPKRLPMTPNRRHWRITLPTSVRGHPCALEAWPCRGHGRTPKTTGEATFLWCGWREGWRSEPEFARRTANPEQMGSSRCSSSRRSCVCSATNCAFPSGVPRILIPSVRHTSSPKLSTLSGTVPRPVPNTRLSLVKLDARVPVQRFRHQVVQMPHPPWLAQQVQIVQECTQSFADQQRLGHFLQSALNAYREQQRHQRVTLFPSFCLRHCPPSPFVVVPIVL